MKQRVLFICTHNSARSQMAEGLLRHFGGERFEVFSAGTEATQVRPLAIRAMAELGIDISRQESKTLDSYLGKPFDEVITVCDRAAEACPVFPGALRHRHRSFEDPSKATGRAALTHCVEAIANYPMLTIVTSKISTELGGIVGG
jgi:arsenate reductase (thioredoxin)